MVQARLERRRVTWAMTPPTPSWLGTHDVLFITLDTLRYDVAQACLRQGQTPNLQARLPGGAWEPRHSPATFTYAAHHAFFAGFLPTPETPGPHPRLLAVRFAGSTTITDETFVFNEATIVEGFKSAGYHTICIGGVGFFNLSSPLGRVLPDLFDEAHWTPQLGVTNPTSTRHQVNLLIKRLAALRRQRAFSFLNVSALHQPNYFYVDGATSDSARTQGAALAYVDGCLAPLFAALRERGPTLCIVCSDHGTAYGEDGYVGHRHAHPVVWRVPYAQWVESPSQPPGEP